MMPTVYWYCSIVFGQVGMHSSFPRRSWKGVERWYEGTQHLGIPYHFTLVETTISDDIHIRCTNETTHQYDAFPIGVRKKRREEENEETDQ
jgi:hypothetical protein